MNIVEVKKGIYSVGSVDWNARSFHGYSTSRGITYNAYLIIDEKITLIDAVKKEFVDDLIARISEIIDPAKIDYLVSNHVEMDHSGGIPAIMKIAKNATIVTSDPSGIKGLKAHYGEEFNYMGVKPGDTLSLGARTLSFVPTPMLHWPDNMVTYCPEEKILFSNDAYGQHYATSKCFDDEVDLSIALWEAKKYYANILMLYKAQAAKALEITKGLDIDIIAPSHGIIWRSHVQDILNAYENYCSDETEDTALVIYDSMWHSTEKMALSILEGFRKKGVTAQLYDLKENHISDVITEVLKARYIVVGSSTLNNNMLPTVAGFLTYLRGLTPRGDKKQAFAFGSYGWGGQSVGQVNDELIKLGYDIILDPIKINYIPSKEQLQEIEDTVAGI